MQTLVFKPSAGRKAIMIVAFLGFTLAGIWMVIEGEIMMKIVGVVAILFFGLGGVLALIRMAKAGNTFTADERGITPGQGGFVPWEHVGQIGESLAGGAKGLGIEVLDVAAYLNTLNPEQRRTVIRYANAAKAVLPGLGDPEAQADHADLDTLPATEQEELQAMAWAKSANGGYDLLFAALTLNRSVAQVAAQLNEYRAEALRRRG